MRKFLIICLFLATAACVSPSAAWSAAVGDDPLHDAPGFDSNRDTVSQMPEEHIDPFTGGLTLTYVDARLPGNGGLDLVIQRSFNSKNMCRSYSDYWGNLKCDDRFFPNYLSYGWTLHFGRVLTDGTQPVIEMPDGSRRAAYADKNASETWITKDYWKLTRSGGIGGTFTLKTTDGRTVVFGNHGTWYGGYAQGDYATQISDVNGNVITVIYQAPQSTLIDHVVDTLSRQINFTYQNVGGSVYKLYQIIGPGIKLTYTYSAAPVSLLTSVQPPLGSPWKYEYSPDAVDLTKVTTPYGGVITYGYTMAPVDLLCLRCVTSKTTGGSVPAGSWTFAYSLEGVLTITDPDGRTTVYDFFRYHDNLSAGNFWQYGLPRSKTTTAVDGTVEEKLTYTWSQSATISNDIYQIGQGLSEGGVYVPRLASVSNQRDERTYTTTYSDFDDYGNPKTITETGDKSRTSILEYLTILSKNIVKYKIKTKSVTGDFPGTFATATTYDNSTGNPLSRNRYGVITNYTYYPNGNLKTVTDANNTTAVYTWTNGRISQITNPLYSTTRNIASNGTVRSETNGRGYLTSYTYDANLRPLSITPPVGKKTVFTYSSDNQNMNQTRGSFKIVNNYDGFMRLVQTRDSKGIVSSTNYMANGLKGNSTSNVGDTVVFDSFGRKKTIVHQDGKSIAFDYRSANLPTTLAITDERNNVTTHTYAAFGDPDEKYLMSVEDPYGADATYTYNMGGSLLTTVQGTSHGNLKRKFNYNTKNFLTKEVHPDSGNCTYDRDPVGNMRSMTDAKGITRFAYDKIHRLKSMARNLSRISFGWDNANNRVSMNSTEGANCTSDFTFFYDKANRLTEKDETIAGVAYATFFDYDGNDNLNGTSYPSASATGRSVAYAYNQASQVKSLSFSDPGQADWGIDPVVYATGGGPATGLVKSYTDSNSIKTDFTFTPRRRLETLKASVGTTLPRTLVSYRYGYNAGGDMKTLQNLLTTESQSFDYDAMNRLDTFNGPWGSGTYTYSHTDTLGNRLTETIYPATGPGGLTVASETDAEELSLSLKRDVSLKDLKNDPAGPLSAATSYSVLYSYDDFNRLAGVSYLNETGDLAAFWYDGDGKRIRKRAPAEDVIYHYDGKGRILSETAIDGAPLCDYVYLNDALVAKVVAGSPDQVYAYQSDAIGSPIAMTLGTQVVWQADYMPFGKEWTVSSSPGNDQRFAGSKKDDETGLNYFIHRYMDSSIGRFTSPDPIGAVNPKTGKPNEKVLSEPQRLNPYVYVSNNPMNAIDPLGLLQLKFQGINTDGQKKL